MTGFDPFALAAAGLIAFGLYGFCVCRHPLRRLLAINLVGNGVFLALILIARRLPDGPDPVPHAMVLTGIVIAVSATAFGLALIRRQARPEDGGND